MNAPTFSPVLVTGASGFVGSCAARRLLDMGFEVHVLLRGQARTWRLHDIRSRLSVHEGDLLDSTAVRSAVEKSGARTVLHLAAYGAYEAQTDARRILETNVLGGYNILEASLARKVDLFINAGSSSEYGYRDTAMNESDCLAPNSVYAVGKAAQTHLCNLLARGSDSGVVTFRLFSVYGPWEEPTRLFPTVLRRALANEPIEMVAPETARDFIFIDDVLDVLLDFTRLCSIKGDVFNLGSGVQSTLREVVAAIQSVTGTRSEVKWGAMKARRWDSTCWKADISKTQSTLNWKPRVDLNEGIRRMAEWLRVNGDVHGNC